MLDIRAARSTSKPPAKPELQHQKPPSKSIIICFIAAHAALGRNSSQAISTTAFAPHSAHKVSAKPQESSSQQPSTPLAPHQKPPCKLKRQGPEPCQEKPGRRRLTATTRAQRDPRHGNCRSLACNTTSQKPTAITTTNPTPNPKTKNLLPFAVPKSYALHDMRRPWRRHSKKYSTTVEKMLSFLRLGGGSHACCCSCCSAQPSSSEICTVRSAMNLQ